MCTFRDRGTAIVRRWRSGKRSALIQRHWHSVQFNLQNRVAQKLLIQKLLVLIISFIFLVLHDI